MAEDLDPAPDQETLVGGRVRPVRVGAVDHALLRVRPRQGNIHTDREDHLKCWVILLNLRMTSIETLVQGDTSRWSKPPVDIKTKVLF